MLFLFTIFDKEIYSTCMKKYISLLILLISVNIVAQEPTNISKKAKSLYAKAKLEYGKSNIDLAIEYLKKAVKKESNYYDAYVAMSELYEIKKNDSLAIVNMKKAISIDSTQASDYYYLAESEFRLGKYTDAIKSYSKSLSKISPSSAKYKKAILKLDRCETALEIISQPVEFNPQKLDSSINTAKDEYWPSMSLDGKTLIVTRLMSDGVLNNPYPMERFQEDFYMSKMVDNKWQPITDVGSPLNTRDNEGAQTISSDGKTIYFTACNRKGGYGGCDIYTSNLVNDTWSKPVNLGGLINSKYWDVQPTISSNSNVLIFASERPGGKGGSDLWMSRRDESGNWQSPKNLKGINTSNDEMSPFLHADGRTLYFASNGYPTVGGHDIYISTVTDSGTFSAPKNIGYPINTYKDESGLIVDAKGENAYYSSNISGNKDIYTFVLPKEVRSNPVTYIKGVVIDAVSKKSLQAVVELINLSTDEVENKILSKVDDGFMLSLPKGNNYSFTTEKKGYLFNSLNISLNNESFLEPLLVTIELERISKDKVVVLNNTFYGFDSSEISPESFGEINRVYNLLIDNPSMKIEVSGHTDNIGSEEHNLQLSDKRAKSVYNYLVKKGVKAERLIWKGYGSSKPIAENDTVDGQKKNRRTEIKVLDL